MLGVSDAMLIQVIVIRDAFALGVLIGGDRQVVTLETRIFVFKESPF